MFVLASPNLQPLCQRQCVHNTETHPAALPQRRRTTYLTGAVDAHVHAVRATRRSVDHLRREAVVEVLTLGHAVQLASVLRYKNKCHCHSNLSEALTSPNRGDFFLTNSLNPTTQQHVVMLFKFLSDAHRNFTLHHKSTLSTSLFCLHLSVKYFVCGSGGSITC